MGKRTKTVQSNLFVTYSLIIIIVVVVFVSFFYFWVSNLLKNKASEAIANLSGSISDKLDIEVQKMDYVSMSVLYSNNVKDRFLKYISESGETSDTLYDENTQKTDHTKNIKELIDVLFAIIGPNRPVQQIYLYDFEGRMFGTGTDNRQRDISVKEKPWFSTIIDYDGKKYISTPMKDEELSKFVSQRKNPYFISLCRLFFDNYNSPQGIVEVKQYYDEIFKNIGHEISDETRIYVYDNNGSIIYPLKETASEKDSYYFKLKKSMPEGKFSITASNPFNNDKELLDFKYSDYTGWTTIIVVSEKKLLSPVFDFTRIVFLVTVLILFFALILSFFVAKKITVPIARLNKAIKAFNLETPIASSPIKLSSSLNELENLNQAFHKMNVELKTSHDELVLSHQHEMQARMLALQSQMNPHFLYNTLATISVMAEESMDEQIVELCCTISDMLRYISSDKFPHVELSKEIEYTEKFLSCMKFRHGTKLSYSIEIDEEMRDIKIPKLVIQPLVENALKYGTYNEPPWNIRISGHRTETCWRVNVCDNGSGFDPEKLSVIRKTMDEIDRNGLLPSLELDGMGLLNIYMRLKLSYKDQTIFEISDDDSGGAIITIGGSF